MLLRAHTDYTVASVQSIPSGVSVLGRSGSRLLVTGDVAGALKVAGSSYASLATDVTLEGFTVEFTAPSGGNQKGIFLDYTDGVKIRDVTVVGADNNAVNVYRSTGLSVDGLTCDEPDDYGLFLYLSRDFHVADLTVQGAARAVVVKGSYNGQEHVGGTVDGARLYGYSTYGFASADLGAEGDLRDVVLSAVRCKDGGASAKGFYVGANGHGYQFLGCVGWNPGNGGYSLAGSGHLIQGGNLHFDASGGAPGIGASGDRLRIVGTEVDGGWRGIYATGADGLLVQGCDVHGQAEHGIHLNNATAVDNATVVGNHIWGNSGYGIYEQGTAGSGSTVTANTAHGNTSGDVQIDNPSTAA